MTNQQDMENIMTYQFIYRDSDGCSKWQNIDAASLDEAQEIFEENQGADWFVILDVVQI